MVSTRGIKLKFCENERVLCYEPDPTKAKVLYDSKVLDVVVTKDQRGKKSAEYLIHFQGWNSSWDRYVSEEYVLKDTPENRQLQKDLAERSQLQLGAYLYRKDRKKSRKTSTARSSDEGSSSSPPRMDTDDAQEVTSSSEDDSSSDDDIIPIELSSELRTCLEQDHSLINTKNKLVKLPAEPNVISILEQYFQYYANNQINDLNDKNNGKNRGVTHPTVKKRPEDVQRNLVVCSEVLEGLRIYFDYNVNNLLLYKSEQNQIQTKQAIYASPWHLNQDDSSTKNMNYLDYVTDSNNASSGESQDDQQQALQRKRSLRSNKGTECVTNGNAQDCPKAKVTTPTPDGSIPETLSKSPSFKLLPDQVALQQPPPPCLVYGAIHLTRLFVRLPELLGVANIEESKWKTLIHHLELFLEYLNEHREWFGETFYVDK